MRLYLHTRLAAVLGLLCALLACGEISPTNPYDPSTPESQQETGSISGGLRLIDPDQPEAVFDPARFQEARIRLIEVGEANTVIGEVVPSPPASADAPATFAFEQIEPGDYLVEAHVQGFLDTTRPVRLEIGVQYQLGDLTLTALNTPESVAYIEGAARRADAPVAGHGGIRVQVQGTPWQAETEDSGAYRVAVAPGLYTVTFATAGYGTETLADVRVVAGETVTLDEVVVQSRPGDIVGQVVLTSPDAEHMFSEQEVLAVALTLVDLDREGVAPRVTNPTADGRFGFDDVPAGHYALSADATGFIGTQATADVSAGEVRNVGALHLEARIDARLFGVARRRCPTEACNHGGILVETVGRPFVTVTGSDGSYLLSVSAGPYEIRYSLDGHASPTPAPVTAEVGENELPDVELVPLPASLQGEVFAEGVGLEGASVVLLAQDPDTGAESAVGPPQASGPGGAVNFTVEVPADTYTLQVGAGRYVSVREPVALAPGRTARFGRIELPLQPGRLTGRVLRSDGVRRGSGVTLLLAGDPADGLTAGRTLRAVTSPPDDAFDVRLPAGAWTITPIAEDYVTPAPTSVGVPAEGEANVELALQRRVHEVQVPAVLGRDAEAVFVRDADLTFGRVWWDTAEPPQDLPLEPLQGPEADRLTFDVGDENRLYTLHFQLANAEFLMDAADPYAALTPILSVNAVLDTQPPEIQRVEIAGGAPVVHTLIVPVSIEATGAETVSVWNAPDAGCDGAPTCGDPEMQPFTGTVVHALDETKVGVEQTVCWMACDDVCNCTTPAAGIARLGTFRDRPTPVLASLSPETIEVHQFEMLPDPDFPDAPPRPTTYITLSGQNIAYDTVAVIGAIELPCERPPGAAEGRDCRADDPADCLDTCVIDLSRPEAGALRDNAGTYPLRLRTPDPVLGGENFSTPRFLTVATFLPIIEAMTPRGITVADLSNPDLRGLLEDAEFGGFDFSRVFPATVDIRVRVCRDADNVQFRLGPNVGRILDDPPPPRIVFPAGTGEPCAGRVGRELRLRFDTDRLVELPEADQVVSVLNPSPGGGVGTAKFGITNVVDNCLAQPTCVAALTSRRPLDATGLSTFFASRTDFSHQFSGLAWRGGDAAALHWRYREEDVPGVLDGSHLLSPAVVRVTPETAGGVVPAFLGQPFAVTVSDARGVAPQVSLHAVSRRNDGRFSGAVTTIDGALGRDPRDVLTEDFDGDGHLDVVVSSCVGNQLTYRRGPLTQAGATTDLPALGCPTALATGDLDSDGLPDLVDLATAAEGVTVRLGRPGGRFSLPVTYDMQARPRALVLGDFDEDGNVDVLTASTEASDEPWDRVAPPVSPAVAPRSKLFVRWGRGTRGFTFPKAIVLPPRPGIDPAPADPPAPVVGAAHLVTADLNRDGLLDLVAAEGGLFRVLRGTGDRDAPFAWFPANRDQSARLGHDVTDLAVGDLDADARPDLVLATADADADPEIHQGGVLTWLGQGDGSFTKRETADLNEVASLHLGDLTGDGRPDVAALDRQGVVQRLDGVGDGHLGEPASVALSDGPARFVVADADRDGAQDLIGYRAGRGQEGLLLRRGVGRRAFGPPHAPLPTETGPVGTVPIDFDRDGHVDVAVLNEEAQSLTFLRGDGQGGFVPALTRMALGLYPSDGLAEDIDGDGWTDLVLTDAGGQHRQVLRGDRGTFVIDDVARVGQRIGYFDPTLACRGPVFPRDRLMAVDLDGDGTRELLHAEAGFVHRLSRYLTGSEFATDLPLPFTDDCGAGFTTWDIDGTLRPVAFSAGTLAVDVLMPEGLTTLYAVRASAALADLGPARWQRIQDRGDIAGFAPYQMFGSGLSTGDFDADGRDDLVVFGQNDDHRYSVVFHPPGHAVLTRADMQAASIGGWLDQLEGTGVLRVSPRLADFNGDDLPDIAGVFPELSVVNLRLRRAPAIGYSDVDELFPTVRAVPSGLEVADVTHDGVPDLFVTNQQDDSLSFWELPGPGEWTLSLADTQRPPVALVPGPQVLAKVRQAFQVVDHLVVTTRLEGRRLDDVTLSLRAPDGRVVPLGRGPANGAWRAYFEAPQVPLDHLHGRQPTGDWQLEAEVGDAAQGALVDFEVITHGAFVQANPGFGPARPRPVRFPIGGTGRALRDTTLGGVDSVDLSCANTGGGQPDRWFEVELAAPTDVSLQLAAGFDAALEVRDGPCAEPGAVRQCVRGRAARVAPLPMDAGRFCVIVDGDPGAGAGIRAGGIDLFVRTADAAPDPCANGGCPPELDAAVLPPLDAASPMLDAGPPPDAGTLDAAVSDQDAGVVGEVMCNGTPCRDTCCVGFAGAHCAVGCGFFEIPALCDGPEDCAAGEQCCADQGTGARCGQCNAAQVEVCHRDVECSAGTCISCAFPGVGSLQMCRENGCP